MTTTNTTIHFPSAERNGETNTLGMRPMQAKVWALRDANYLLLKSPPASGKSRALMYIALHKIQSGQVKKCIVAVPERTIGSSFSDTDLTSSGFFQDWVVNPAYNLCSDDVTNSGELTKRAKFAAFIESEDTLLVCTHASLRGAYAALGAQAFNDCFIAIDEFHHVSVDEENRLGVLLSDIIQTTNAHIMPMTGSYFRGDTNALLRPEQESLFQSVVYTYYEQMQGYAHLKEVNIGHHFYQGAYIDAIGEVLDHTKKTIIHIPHVSSAESTKDKFNELDVIIDTLGTVEGEEADSGFLLIRHSSGALIRLANLVDDDSKPRRDKVLRALRDPSLRDKVDVVVALGMGKEGFDLPPLEVAITVGYRGSLTEVVQIIGRITRDFPGKKSAQFINLIAEPMANQALVTDAVNDLLKAISASLLMEQVMAPQFRFNSTPKTPDGGDNEPSPGDITIRGLKQPNSEQAKQVIKMDLSDLIARVCQDPRAQQHAIFNPDTAAEKINQETVPSIIQARYPDLAPDDAESVRQHVVAQMTMLSLFPSPDEGSPGSGSNDAPDGSDDTPPTDDGNGDEKRSRTPALLTKSRQFIDIHNLSIDMIDSINPFKNSYEVIARALSTNTLAQIRAAIREQKQLLTADEAMTLLPKIRHFVEQNGRKPDMESNNEQEVELAEASFIINREVAKRRAELRQSEHPNAGQ